MADIVQEVWGQKQQAEAMNPASQPTYEAAQENAQMVSQGVTPTIPSEFKPAPTAQAPHPMDVGRQARAAGVAPEALNPILSKAYDEYVHDQALRNLTKFYPQMRPTQYWISENALPSEAQVGFSPEDFPPQERIPEMYPKAYSRMIPVPEGMTPEEAKVLQQQRDADLAAYTGTRLMGMLTWIPGYGELSQELLPEVKEFENEYYQTHAGGEVVTANLSAMALAAPLFQYTVGGLTMKATYGAVRSTGRAATAIPEVQEILTGAGRTLTRVLPKKVSTTAVKWIGQVFPGATADKDALGPLQARVEGTGGRFLASGEIMLGPTATPENAKEIAEMVKVLRSTLGHEGTKVKLVRELAPAMKQAVSTLAASTTTGAVVGGLDQGLRGRSFEDARSGAKWGAVFGAGWGGYSGVRQAFQMASPTTVGPTAAAAARAPEEPVILEMPRRTPSLGFVDPRFETAPATNYDRILLASQAGDALTQVMEEGRTVFVRLKDPNTVSPDELKRLQGRLIELQKQSMYYQQKHEALSSDDYFARKGR